jgi:hypothetical protein
MERKAAACSLGAPKLAPNFQLISPPESNLNAISVYFLRPNHAHLCLVLATVLISKSRHRNILASGGSFENTST